MQIWLFLLVFLFPSSFSSSLGLKHKAGCPWQPWEKLPPLLHFHPGRWRGAFCAALCSFSSAAHLVGYYAKEMESIAERWVTLFTGKKRRPTAGNHTRPIWRFLENPVVSQGGRKSAQNWKRLAESCWTFTVEKEERWPNVWANPIVPPWGGWAGRISHTAHSISAHSHVLHQSFNQDMIKQCKGPWAGSTITMKTRSRSVWKQLAGAQPVVMWKQHMGLLF